jgi:hypothetical protein
MSLRLKRDRSIILGCSRLKRALHQSVTRNRTGDLCPCVARRYDRGAVRGTSAFEWSGSRPGSAAKGAHYQHVARSIIVEVVEKRVRESRGDGRPNLFMQLRVDGQHITDTTDRDYQVFIIFIPLAYWWAEDRWFGVG